MKKNYTAEQKYLLNQIRKNLIITITARILNIIKIISAVCMIYSLVKSSVIITKFCYISAIVCGIALVLSYFADRLFRTKMLEMIMLQQKIKEGK